MDLFEKKIIEVYDPVHNQKYWFVRCKNSEEFTDILTKIIPGYQDMVLQESDEEDRGGECLDLVLDGKLVIIFWCDLLDANAVSHECLHAVLFSARSRGISLTDDESLCYMLGFLVEGILTGANVSLRKGRKPKEVTLQPIKHLEIKPEVKLDGNPPK